MAKTVSPEEHKKAIIGRLIGFEAVAKERYRLVVVDTVNGEIADRVDIDNGKPMQMHTAFYRFNSLVNKMIRFFLPNLWRFNPDIVGKEAAREALTDYEKASSVGKMMGGK
jgi:hypothetical protein